MLNSFLGFFHNTLAGWFHFIDHWGYLGIILLMAMESSIFPVPSEMVVPPAAFLIAQGKMSFWGIVLAGTLGSYLGAAITYWISRWVGRAVILRWGKYFFISEKKLILAEHWMHRYEAGGIFFARLLPVVRHLISIPAGIVRMPFGMFSLMTVVGSFAWCSVLAFLGKWAFDTNKKKLTTPQEISDFFNDPKQMGDFFNDKMLWIIGGIAALAVLYFLVLKLTAKAEKPPCCAESTE